jgi:hypothetical protein
MVHAGKVEHRPAGAARRFVFIDLYRSAVILLMLEGHVVREVLAPDVQSSGTFIFHEFFHGLSAPAFLFGAGLTFVVSTRNRWSEYHHWGAPLAKRMGRLLLILALGFAIHLPYYSFRKILMNGTEVDYLQLFQCDVLHCIGLGLLALHGLVFFFRSQERFYGLVFSIIISVCLLTPVVWDTEFLGLLPLPFAQMLNSLHGSPFPLFPYIGFLFTGVLVSWEFMVSQQRGTTPAFMQRLALIGITLIAAGLILDAVPMRLYPTYNFWYTSPNYFLIRTGSLFLLCTASWYAAERWKPSNKLFVVAGQESLFIYVLHLPLLYGSVINPATNITTIIGAGMSFPEASGIALLFMVGMFVLAVGWNYLKRHYFTAYRVVQVALAFWFLAGFFTRDN